MASHADKDRTAEVLELLQSKGDLYAKTSLFEKKRSTDLEEAIDHIIDGYKEKSKLAAIRVMNAHILTPKDAYQRADGVDVGRQATHVTKKVLSIMETKLNKLLQKKSLVTARHAELKHLITHSRKLRLQTDLSHDKLVDSLQDYRHRIENMLMEATDVLEEREKTLRAKESLEARNAEEQMNMTRDYENMGQYIKEQNSALESMLFRERKGDFNTTMARSIQSGNDESLHKAELAEYEANSSNTNLQSYMQVQADIVSLEDKFEQIRKLTNCETLDEVVRQYVLHEEEMFSMYNYTQTINNEIDSVEESCVGVEADIEAYKLSVKDQSEARLRKQQELEEKLKATTEVSRRIQAQNQQQRECVDQLSKKVQSMFYKLQCDQLLSEPKTTLSLHGKKKTSHRGGGLMFRQDSRIASLTRQIAGENNVLEFVAAIEQRAVDIVAEYEASLRHKSQRLSPSIGPHSPAHWQNEYMGEGIDFNAAEFYYDYPDETDKPIDLTTLKSTYLQKLSSKESSSSKRSPN